MQLTGYRNEARSLQGQPRTSLLQLASGLM